MTLENLVFSQHTIFLAILACYTMVSIPLARITLLNFHTQSRFRYCFFLAIYIVTPLGNKILCILLIEAEKFHRIVCSRDESQTTSWKVQFPAQETAEHLFSLREDSQTHKFLYTTDLLIPNGSIVPLFQAF